MLLCGAPGIIQLTLALSVGLTIAGDALRVATFNIRQQAEGKTIKGASNTEEHDWRERRDGLLKQLIEAELHAISLQETAPWQKAWLEDQLSRKGYKAVPSDSEHSLAIFYKISSLTLVDQERFWFSKTPDVPSRSWGAKFNASALVATFKFEGTSVTILNCHLDYKSKKARQNSARLILKRLQSKVDDAGAPLVLVVGDLNAEADSEETYTTLTGNRYAGNSAKASDGNDNPDTNDESEEEYDDQDEDRQLLPPASRIEVSRLRRRTKQSQAAHIDMSSPTTKRRRRRIIHNRRETQHIRRGSISFLDTRQEVDAPAISTFTDFTDPPADRVIDYILVAEEQTRFKTVSHMVYSNDDGGIRISDHQLVVTEFSYDP